MMLSSLNPGEIEKAIIGSDVNILKSVKGIGLKTAQRIIVDLKDKLGKQPEAVKYLLLQTIQRGKKRYLH